MKMPFAAVHESAFGTKRTSSNVRSSVANGGKADMARTVQVGRGNGHDHNLETITNRVVRTSN